MERTRNRLTGRRMAFGLLCLGMLAPAIGPAKSTKAGPSTSRPNVLIVITDDQRNGVGVMPALRAYMGAKGTRFPNAYVTTPNCCPSRSSIFTGRYSHNHGVINNRLAYALDQETTLQYYLKQAGYRTGLFGKYLNFYRDPLPYFDSWANHGSGVSGFYWGTRWRTSRGFVYPGGYSTTFVKHSALNFLKGNETRADSQPWFMAVTPLAPHRPFEPDEKYMDAPVPDKPPPPSALEEDRSDKPPFVQERNSSPETGVRIRDQQLRTLMSVDDMIERIFEMLTDLGESRNTLVVFTSDNGFMWGDHGLTGKVVPYTGSIRVPLYMRWPAEIEPRSVDDRLVANIDIAPTILDATNIEPTTPVDGRSLLDPTWEREHLLIENPGPESERPAWASLRGLNHQYTEYYDDLGATTFSEYYDLIEDPWQLENLLAGPGPNPGLGMLETRLEQARSCVGAVDCP